jgi:glycosyl transferase family 87
VKVTPAHRLHVLGIILLVSLVVCARGFGGQGEAFPVIPLLVAGGAYLLVIRELFHTASFPITVIVVGLAFAALWHIAFLTVPTGSDDDVRRYVWDGRLQRLGYNPYVVVPDDPAVAALHTPETRTLNHSDLPSPYPPGAQLFFRVVTAIHESTLAMRIALMICELGMVIILFRILRATEQGATWILAFAWNPLLATEVAGSGHIDILGALLLLISFAALLRRWRTVAAVAFALAVAVKFLPIVLLPLYWRRIRIRDAVVGAIVFVVLYLPFLHHARIPSGSLGTYVQSFRFNDPLFSRVERFVSPQLAAGFAAGIGILIAIWFRARSETVSADAFAWPMATSLLCAPVIYPWYLLWMLPFTRSISTFPILIWTVSIIPTYIVWHVRAAGHPWILPWYVMPLEYGALAVSAALVLFRRILKSSTLRNTTD